MKPKKIQFAFHPLTIKLLERLVDERGALSKAEVVRDAISVFLWMHDHIKKGYKILAIKGDHIIEPVYPNIFPEQKSISVNASEDVIKKSKKIKDTDTVNLEYIKQKAAL